MDSVCRFEEGFRQSVEGGFVVGLTSAGCGGVDCECCQSLV